MDVYTLSGKKLVLGKPLNSGGEGTIHEITGFPRKVAKIYHSNMGNKARENKIKEMVRLSESYAFKSANISDSIAWPLAPLFDSNKNFVGFGMNKISAQNELDDLYIYPPQQNAKVTMANRIDCLISLCQVIEKLHNIGQVFGDFNPNNIKINDDWRVNFVDADSYHIINAGREHRCIVCAPGYVAPELIKACKGTTYADYAGKTFTKETDRFALAIHCFRMLMNGCHPFICQYQITRGGSLPAPKPIDKRVENGDTPFFKNISRYTTPVYAPNIKALPPYIRDLFKRAFVDGHDNPAARPTATEWKNALKKYKTETIKCKNNCTHYYWKANGYCPYCEADKNYSNQSAPRQQQSHYVTTNNAPTNITATSTKKNNKVTTTVSNKVAKLKATPKTTAKGLKSHAAFWTISIILSLVAISLLGFFVLPYLYNEVTCEDWVIGLGTIGGCISGLVGTILYNLFWTPNYRGPYKWSDYVLSLLTCIGFVFGFGVLMGLIFLIGVIIYYILIAAFFIGILVALFSGG